MFSPRTLLGNLDAADLQLAGLGPGSLANIKQEPGLCALLDHFTPRCGDFSAAASNIAGILQCYGMNPTTPTLLGLNEFMPAGSLPTTPLLGGALFHHAGPCFQQQHSEAEVEQSRRFLQRAAELQTRYQQLWQEEERELERGNQLAILGGCWVSAAAPAPVAEPPMPAAPARGTCGLPGPTTAAQHPPPLNPTPMTAMPSTSMAAATIRRHHTPASTSPPFSPRLPNSAGLPSIGRISTCGARLAALSDVGTPHVGGAGDMSCALLQPLSSGLESGGGAHGSGHGHHHHGGHAAAAAAALLMSPTVSGGYHTSLAALLHHTPETPPSIRKALTMDDPMMEDPAQATEPHPVGALTHGTLLGAPQLHMGLGSGSMGSLLLPHHHQRHPLQMHAAGAGAVHGTRGPSRLSLGEVGTPHYHSDLTLPQAGPLDLGGADGMAVVFSSSPSKGGVAGHAYPGAAPAGGPQQQPQTLSRQQLLLQPALLAAQGILPNLYGML